MSRLVRVALATCLVFTMSTWALAGCLPSDATAMAQMTCCQTGHHDCGPAMKAADCCRSDSSNQSAFVATNPLGTAKALVGLSSTPVVDLGVPAVSTAIRRVTTLTRSSSPPTFQRVPLRI